MAVSHDIDKDHKVITTRWQGKAVDHELIAALSAYMSQIRNQPEYAGYDEILDFTDTTGFGLTSDGIRRLINIAVRGDQSTFKTRLAIVVTSPVAFGLARMYQTYRGLVPGTSKELRLFRSYEHAWAWVSEPEGA